MVLRGDSVITGGIDGSEPLRGLNLNVGPHDIGAVGCAVDLYRLDARNSPQGRLHIQGTSAARHAFDDHLRLPQMVIGCVGFNQRTEGCPAFGVV